MPDSTAQPKTVVVTGASGLVGPPLMAALEADGYRVIQAVRRKTQNDRELSWDPAAGKIERDKLEGVDAVIHLAGANIAGKRWTTAYKKQLIDSRVDGTTLIAKTIASLDRKPRVFASASAIGYYGDRAGVQNGEELDESAACGQSFLPELCMQWERACQPARDAGIRTANLRIGVVLTPTGGAIAKMLLPFKLGLGGILGHGRQYFSWISLDDVVSAMLFVLKNDSLDGPVNLVTPNPVTNHEFTKTLGQVLSRPTIFPMPAFAARLAFGEMADAALLASARVVPTALTTAGFVYQHPTLEPALRYLLQRK